MNRYLLTSALVAVISMMSVGSAFADTDASINTIASSGDDQSIAANPAGSTVNLDKGASCSRGGCDFKSTLTDAQLEQLRSLRDKYSVDNATKKAQLQTLHHQLMDQLGAANIDKSAVLATQEKINSLRNDLSNSRLGMMLEASNVFTPEQRLQMHQRMLRRGFGGRHHGHHGGRGHGGFHGGSRGPAPGPDSASQESISPPTQG